MSEKTGELALARQMAEFLSKPTDYRGVSPIEERVRAEISKIANQMAVEIVGSATGLHDVIRERINALIARALRDDEYLSDVIGKALGKALGQLVQERGADD